MAQRVESFEGLLVMLISAGAPENIADMYDQTQIVRVQRLKDKAVLNLLPLVIRGIAEHRERKRSRGIWFRCFRTASQQKEANEQQQYNRTGPNFSPPCHSCQ